MDIKEILLNGGTVSFSYKETKNSYMGSAKLWIFSGMCEYKPYIVLECWSKDVTDGTIKYSIDQIDEAISKFKELVFRKQNIALFANNAQINLADKHLDLDDEKDFKIFEKERKRLIREYFKQ